MLDVCNGDIERTELYCFNLGKREWHWWLPQDQAEQDEETVPEFKQSMIAFFKIVRIDLGSHNVASPLLDGECIDVHPFIEGLAVCLFDLNSKIE